MKKVSVIVPIYNTEKYIESCIDSILNQTYPNIEIILVEDKSTDSTFSYLEKYQNNSNVVLLVNDKNRGVGYSRNKGIEYSSGEYLMFIDSDDVIEQKMIEQLVYALESGKTDMSMCGYDTFFHTTIPIKKDLSSFEVIDVESDDKLLNQCGGACWAKLFKRSLVENLRFPEGIVYEDAAFTFPAMIKSRFISFLDSPLYHYRFNLNGITKKNKKGPNRNILDLYPASLLLDRNYKLVRRNDSLDNKMRELGYSILFLGALDSSFWFQMKGRKELANSFLALANKRYGYTSHHDTSYLQEKIRTNPFLSIRIKYLDTFVFQKKLQLEKEENELMSEIRRYLEAYLSQKRNKCKVKKK